MEIKYKNIATEYIGKNKIDYDVENVASRNQTLNDFLIFIDDYIFNLLKGVKVLKSYKNYTVKKDDKYIR